MSNTFQSQTNAYGRSFDLNFDRQLPGYHDRLGNGVRHDPLHFIVRKDLADQNHATEAVELKSFSLLAIKVTGFMAMIAIVFYFAASWYGDKVSKAGHTSEIALKQLSIGNHDFSIPLNMLRFNSQRQAGALARADLYAHWPSLSGYSENLAHDFDSLKDDAPIIFISIESQIMAADMYGRLNSVYTKFLDQSSKTTEHKLTKVSFASSSPYVMEDLYYAHDTNLKGVDRYAVRCISESQQNASTICMRDVNVEGNLNVSYRFHKSLLDQWPILEQNVLRRVKAMKLN